MSPTVPAAARGLVPAVVVLVALAAGCAAGPADPDAPAGASPVAGVSAPAKATPPAGRPAPGPGAADSRAADAPPTPAGGGGPTAGSADAAVSASAPPASTGTAATRAVDATPAEVLVGHTAVYSDRLVGRRTANGERYDRTAMTAAHKTLPFGTVVRVTNPRNGRSVDVRINDRGPFHPDRILDLSAAAAIGIGLDPRSVARIEATIVSRPSAAR
jgi:rare lipoprotein A